MKKFKVYQASTETPYVFFDFDVAFKRFSFEDYTLVCEGESDFDDIDYVLNDVFESGNIGELRKNNRMRSISVSDIIEVDGKYFYVEGFGFKDITSYIK